MNASKNIFQDVPDGIDGTWRYGVLLGGMADMALGTRAQLAASYKRAGDVLIEAALNADEAHEFAYPILFTYRHSLELYLKAIVEPSTREHDFVGLLDRFQRVILAHFDVPVPAWVIERLLEFQDVDERSTTFRYQDKKIRFQSGTFVDEVWVDLQNVRSVMERLDATFRKILQQLPNMRMEPARADS